MGGDLPRTWLVTITVPCSKCRDFKVSESASIPRIKNALREIGWRYVVDTDSWMCPSCKPEAME